MEIYLQIQQKNQPMTMNASIRWNWWNDTTISRPHWLMIPQICRFKRFPSSSEIKTLESHEWMTHKLYLNSQLTHTKCTVFDAVGKSTASINFKILSWKAEKTRGSTNANKMRRQIVYFPIFTLLKNKNPWKFGWTEHQEVRVRTRASWKVGKRAVTPCWQ